MPLLSELCCPGCGSVAPAFNSLNLQLCSKLWVPRTQGKSMEKVYF